MKASFVASLEAASEAERKIGRLACVITPARPPHRLMLVEEEPILQAYR